MSRWIERAVRAGAELVHFPETALTGYHRAHLKDPRRIDREKLALFDSHLRRKAAICGIWLAYGSTHFEAGHDLPFNCLYLVNPSGEEVCRYDKIFLTDTDLEAYTPGNRIAIARVKDFQVGLTICFDMRFPELFRSYLAAGVDLILISSYQAGGERAAHMRIVAPANLITRAAENGIYLSASNTSQAPSWHESLVVKFNGRPLAQARRHRPSMALATLDLDDHEPFTDFIRETAQKTRWGKYPGLDLPLCSD